ncbi:MAG: hypothetical protein ACYDEI_05590 [Erysipelotrichaceae bacterium]
MSKRFYAALYLFIMAILSFISFVIYSIISSDSEGVTISIITSIMFIALAILSMIRFRPWK